MDKTTEKKQIVSLDQLAFSVRQVSQITSLSISFVRDEISGGAIQHIRRRGRILILRDELKKYLNKEQIGGKRQK
jgi:DNA phosphorothioation-dependent restriction protein DptG